VVGRLLIAASVIVVLLIAWGAFAVNQLGYAWPYPGVLPGTISFHGATYFKQSGCHPRRWWDEHGALAEPRLRNASGRSRAPSASVARPSTAFIAVRSTGTSSCPRAGATSCMRRTPPATERRSKEVVRLNVSHWRTGTSDPASESATQAPSPAWIARRSEPGYMPRDRTHPPVLAAAEKAADGRLTLSRSLLRLDPPIEVSLHWPAEGRTSPPPPIGRVQVFHFVVPTQAVRIAERLGDLAEVIVHAREPGIDLLSARGTELVEGFFDGVAHDERPDIVVAVPHHLIGVSGRIEFAGEPLDVHSPSHERVLKLLIDRAEPDDGTGQLTPLGLAQRAEQFFQRLRFGWFRHALRETVAGVIGAATAVNRSADTGDANMSLTGDALYERPASFAGVRAVVDEHGMTMPADRQRLRVKGVRVIHTGHDAVPALVRALGDGVDAPIGVLAVELRDGVIRHVRTVAHVGAGLDPSCAGHSQAGLESGGSERAERGEVNRVHRAREGRRWIAHRPHGQLR
jgi:hypothetical protein